MKSDPIHCGTDLTQFYPKCGYDLAGLAGSICPKCGSPFDRNKLKYTARNTPLPLSVAKTILISIGVIWAILAWLRWPFTPHRGFQTAAICGILLAPSYILLSLAPGKMVAMRAFVITAIAVLIAAATILRGYDLVGLYLIAPPVAAIITFILRSGILRNT